MTPERSLKLVSGRSAGHNTALASLHLYIILIRYRIPSVLTVGMIRGGMRRLVEQELIVGW